MTDIEPYLGARDRQVVIAPAPTAEAPSQGDAIDIAGLFGAFRRRLGLFAITVVAMIALTVAFLLVYPPKYTATARVAVNNRTISSTPDKETPVVAQLPQQSSSVDAEVQLIQSRRVAERVVEMLHLDKDPEFAPLNPNRHSLLQSVTLFFAPLKARSRSDEVVSAVLANLLPARFQTTNAIDINYSNRSARKAQRIANAWAQAYLDDQIAAKAGSGRQAVAGVLSQIESMREAAAQDAAKVDAYKVAHNLMSVGVQTLTEQEISTYNQSVAVAKAEAAGDQANLRTAQEQLARGSTGDDVGEALNSPVVGALRAQRATVSAKLADLESHYGPKYPNLAQTRSQLADIDKEIQAEIQRTISNLAAKATVSQKRLETTQATLAAAKGALAANTAAEAGLQDLTRRAAVSQSIYEAYLARSKESVAQLSNLTPDAQILSNASLPESPSFPNAILFLALGLVAGVMFGCVAVVVAEATETRLITSSDVERRLGRPYLGAIPLLASASAGKGGSPVDAVVDEPASAYSEAFRALRAALPGDSSQVVLITSACPQEGKTALAIGLARTTALQGTATVMVDCDARRRGLTRGLKLGGMGPGLLEVLKDEAGLFEALVPDVASGAMVLPIATAGPSAHELLTGEAMDDLLEMLRERFQCIVIDTAPALPVAATRGIAAKADAVVLAVHWRKTSEAAVRAALRLLRDGEVRLAGVVLSRVDLRQMARYGAADTAGLFKKFRQYYA
jgi:uncharacterized protein involved in exopolysaccharide biosynthesis/Mrp family chromosome partitioning ATPase